MEVRRKSLYMVRIVADCIVLITSFWMAALVSLSLEKTTVRRPTELLLALGIVWFVSANLTRFYDEFKSRDYRFEALAVVQSTLIQVFSSAVILFFMGDEPVSRFFVVTYGVFLMAGLIIERLIFRGGLEYLRRRGVNLRYLLIVGAGKVGRKFYDSIKGNPQFGYVPVGFVDDNTKPDLNGQYLGRIDDLERLIEKHKVRDVIITLPNSALRRVQEVIQICEKHATRVRIIPEYIKYAPNRYGVSMFGRFPVISVREYRINELHARFLKRTFDFFFSLLLFVALFWWLWPLIALTIKISSPGKVFFCQERWGRDNRRFHAYKFRSMVAFSKDVDEDGKYLQAVKNDCRITRVGKFLRRTNLDELPQFWNVLKGDMSVVGPRPHPTPLNLESKDSIPFYMLRHLVKPGVTGLAQVNGYRGETDSQIKMQRRVEHDIWYIGNWSFFLDPRIIFMTIVQTLKGDPKAY